VEAWVKPTVLTGQSQAIVHKGGSAGYSVWQYRLGLSYTNQWRAFVYVGDDAITVTDPGTPSLTEFTHLVLTKP
jgi:hypothetical protein